jgi:hypothetical protein
LSKSLTSKLAKVSLPRRSVVGCKPIRVEATVPSQVGTVKRKKAALVSVVITEIIDEMMITEVEIVGTEIKLSALRQVCLQSLHFRWLGSRFPFQLTPTACQCFLLVSYFRVKQPRSHNSHHLQDIAPRDGN